MRKIKNSPLLAPLPNPRPRLSRSIPIADLALTVCAGLLQVGPRVPGGSFLFLVPRQGNTKQILRTGFCALKNSALVTACRPRGRSRGFAQQACLVASPLRVMPLSHHHLPCRCLGPFPCPLVSSPLSVKLPSSTRCRCNARSLRRSASTSCSNSERKIFSRA